MRVSLEQAAAVLLRKAREVERRLRAAEAENAKEALAIARAYSSGPFSARMLAAMGHPYARRAPRPPDRPAIINLQTGAFRAAWRVVRAGDVTRVVNDSPLAPFFSRGTTVMIRRPIARAVAQAMRQKREKRLREAVKAGLEAR